MNGVVSYSVISSESPVVFLLIGDFAYGCCGSMSAMSQACMSYVAQRTPPARRMVRITVLQLCLLVAGMLTGIVIGQLMAAVGKDNTVLLSICVALANFVYVFVFLREDGAKVGGARDPPTVSTESERRRQSHIGGGGGQSRIYDEDRARLVGRDLQHVAADLDTSGYGQDAEYIPEFLSLIHISEPTRPY